MCYSYTFDFICKTNNYFHQEYFANDTQIITQGDKATKCYIIIGGTVLLTKDNQDVEESIAILKKGDHFGKEAFSNDEQNFYEFNAVTINSGVDCFTIETR